MPLQATSGAASYDAFGGGAAAVPQYIEDVFLTYLYAGDGTSSRTITTNFDLSTKGGLVWLKNRTSAYSNMLVDTTRGIGFPVISDGPNAQAGSATGLSSVSTTGFVTNATANSFGQNTTSTNIVTWSFKKQPKFFDIVTYTGTGANRTISHNLGSVPGCIMVKRTDTSGDWQVYHRSLANTEYIVLNSTAVNATGATRWNSTTPTSTVFSVGTDATVNASGGTYVAYIYAHNAGGFGLTGTDNVISCGTVTIPASGSIDVNLGYEPQFIILKAISTTGEWYMFDTMRGWTNGSNDAYLLANQSSAETSASLGIAPIATGFNIDTIFGANYIYIYIAIRKGPMKVPTDATTVFSPITSNSVLDTAQTTGFPVDAQMLFWRVSGGLIGPRMVSRLQGVATTATSSADSYLQTNLTDDRATGSNTRSWNNTGFVTPTSWASASMVYESFRRAPTFFDQVCYSGTGSNTTQTHNLNKIPELIFVKSTTAATANWAVYSSALANTEYLVLNTNAGKATGASWWNSTTPTSSVFSLGTSSTVNVGGATYVAYLFATCAGVSKVGSYTGTGTLTTIDCGFTGGARFVLIKRTDTNGDWYVWDTARGMVAGTDPSFRTNSAASEVNANSVYTIATGFQLLASPSAPVNTNGGTYIFLAIA